MRWIRTAEEDTAFHVGDMLISPEGNKYKLDFIFSNGEISLLPIVETAAGEDAFLVSFPTTMAWIVSQGFKRADRSQNESVA